MALQCPRCELRFDLGPMLADHLRTDHAVDPADTVHLQPPAARVGTRLEPPPDGPGGRRRPEDPPQVPDDPPAGER